MTFVVFPPVPSSPHLPNRTSVVGKAQWPKYRHGSTADDLKVTITWLTWIKYLWLGNYVAALSFRISPIAFSLMLVCRLLLIAKFLLENLLNIITCCTAFSKTRNIATLLPSSKKLSSIYVYASLAIKMSAYSIAQI
jgi:hypothetical protein